MNLDACLDRVLARVGRSGSASVRASALAEMALLQTEYEESLAPLWFLFQTFTITTVANQAAYAVNASFRRFAEERTRITYLYQGSTVDVEIVDGFDMDGVTRSVNGPPKALSLTGSTFTLYPTPDGIYTLSFVALGADTPPVDAASANAFSTNAPQLLIARTAFVVAKDILQDDALAAKLQVDVTRAEERLMRFNVAREFSGRTYAVGE